MGSCLLSCQANRVVERIFVSIKETAQKVPKLLRRNLLYSIRIAMLLTRILTPRPHDSKLTLDAVMGRPSRA